MITRYHLWCSSGFLASYYEDELGKMQEYIDIMGDKEYMQGLYITIEICITRRYYIGD